MTRRKASRRRISRRGRKPGRRAARRPRKAEEGAEAGAKLEAEAKAIPGAGASITAGEAAEAGAPVIRRRGEAKRICPICGLPGWLERRVRVTGRGEQVYYYMVHVEKADGGRRFRRCYLGPDVYRAAKRINPITLTGALDPGRFLRYSLELLDKLTLEELETLRSRIDERIAILRGEAGAHGQ
jgi:hypothetical protein